jgi:hypothetical protein
MTYEEQTLYWADSDGFLPAGIYVSVLDDHGLDPTQYMQAVPLAFWNHAETLLAYVRGRIS